MSITTDAVVIGGGVMGTSIIYNLAIRGMDAPVLLERSTLGSGSTGRSSGIIRMHYSTEISTKLAWGSYQIFQNFTISHPTSYPIKMQTMYLMLTLLKKSRIKLSIL